MIDIDDAEDAFDRAFEEAIGQPCPRCLGTGQDGDAPDANGEGGWVGKCERCDGTGRLAGNSSVQQGK